MGRAKLVDDTFSDGVTPVTNRSTTVVNTGHPCGIGAGGHVDLPVITPLC